MKTVIWVSAVSVIIAIASAVTLCRLFYYPDSNPWLLEIPPAVEAQVKTIKDIERLRDVTLYLLRSDQKEKQLINVSLQSVTKTTIGLLMVLASLASYSCYAACKGVCAEKHSEP